VVKVVGPSGSGKTTAIVEAVRRLKAMGLRVAVLKHTHHDIDTPGKDSWRFLEEGGADASIVVKGGGERVAVFARMPVEDVLRLLSLSFDVVLVEGFRGSGLPAHATLQAGGEGWSGETLFRAVLEACRLGGGRGGP
jgi:molybdopterin-guanine dinucleotide biosynthesis protein B